MSQPTETQPTSMTTTPVIQETSAVDATTLVESYADGLMDSLFSSVDRLLEGDEAAIKAVLAGQPDAPVENSPSETMATVAAPLVPLTGTLDFPRPSAEPSQPSAPEGNWFSRHLSQLLLGVAVVATAGVAGLWFINQQPSVSEVPTSAPTEDLQAEANAEFLQYLQRSLEVIHSGANGTGTGADTPTDMPQVAVVPNQPVPGDPVQTAPNSGRPGPINVIERVYVPYQPAQPAAPSPAAAPQITPTSPQVAADTAPAPSQPVTNHTLMGVLELGERSAALFEIDGVTQRVSIGGRIGESGWTLVSVSNEEAVIRRNGEVRSIYIGQKF